MPESTEGVFRGSDHCDEWRKPLNIELFDRFLRGENRHFLGMCCQE